MLITKFPCLIYQWAVHSSFAGQAKSSLTCHTETRSKACCNVLTDHDCVEYTMNSPQHCKIFISLRRFLIPRLLILASLAKKKLLFGLVCLKQSEHLIKQMSTHIICDIYGSDLRKDVIAMQRRKETNIVSLLPNQSQHLSQSRAHHSRETKKNQRLVTLSPCHTQSQQPNPYVS